MLTGVNVALGVTGSIAAVRTVELAHELRRRGANVRAVTTPSASSIVHPWSLEFATGADVVTEITGRIEHVELCGEDGWADVLLIAPATANTIGKIAGAIDDTPVTTCATTALGAGLPVVVAPAMHEPMYDHPGVLDAIETIDEWGVRFVDPRIEEGKAKIADTDAIALEVARATTDPVLAGTHVVVTSGATAERIDPVRVLTNRSSGKMGRAVGRGCYVLGARVTLVHGVVGPGPFTGDAGGADASAIPGGDVRHVESADEMRAATLDAVSEADAFVSVAAVSDYTVEPASEKLRSGQERTLSLEPVPKLVDAVREAHPDLAIVGFKAETGGTDDDLVGAARELRERVDAAFVVANDAGSMGADETRTLFVDASETREHAGSKAEIGVEVARTLRTSIDASSNE